MRVLFFAVRVAAGFLMWRHNLAYPPLQFLKQKPSIATSDDAKRFFWRLADALVSFFKDAQTNDLGKFVTSSLLVLVVTWAILTASVSKTSFLFLQGFHLIGVGAIAPLFFTVFSVSSARRSSGSSASLLPWVYALANVVILTLLEKLGTKDPLWEKLFLVAYMGLPILMFLANPSPRSGLFGLLAAAGITSAVHSVPPLLPLLEKLPVSYDALVKQSFVNHAAGSITWDYLGLVAASLLVVLFDRSGSVVRKLLFVPLVLALPSVFFPLYLATRSNYVASSSNSSSSNNKKSKKD